MRYTNVNDTAKVLKPVKGSQCLFCVRGIFFTFYLLYFPKNSTEMIL